MITMLDGVNNRMMEVFTVFPGVKTSGPIEVSSQSRPRVTSSSFLGAKAPGPLKLVPYMGWVLNNNMYPSEEEHIKSLKMFDITVERAHLKGKNPEDWTDEEGKRFEAELEKIPGKYRDILNYNGWCHDPENQKNAKELGIDVREWYKILYTGNEGYIHNHNKLETNMEEKPLPGYVYGFGMPDMVFKHT